MRVWEDLGRDKPRKAAGVKAEKEEEEARRPLSPVEPGSATVANELPIQVKTDGEGETVKAGDSVDVKEEREVVAEGSAQPQNGRASTTQTPTAETQRKGKPGRKKAYDLSQKPYEGFFEAVFRPESDMFEITDLRADVEGGHKVWLEAVSCLVCGTRIH